MIRSLKLSPQHAEKVLAAFLATCVAQFTVLLTLTKPVQALFGVYVATQYAQWLEKGAAVCTILLGVLGFVLALSHSIDDKPPP